MEVTEVKHVCTEEICRKEFLIIHKEAEYYQRKGLPFPTQCPACRHKIRMALRSERRLYRRNCAKCRVSMLSVYPSDCEYTIYCQECFWRHIG